MRPAKTSPQASDGDNRSTRDLVLAAAPWLMTAVIALFAIASA